MTHNDFRYTRRRLFGRAALAAAAAGTAVGIAASRRAYPAPGEATSPPSAAGWVKVRDMTLYGNYHGPTVLGPVTKASFQGFGGGPSWSGDSRYVFAPTQEGDNGIIRIDTRSGQSVVLSYACNNAVYSNPRKSAQFGGCVACNNTVSSKIQVIQAATMASANPHWPADLGATSQAVQIDAAYVYLAHDGTPGTLTATSIERGVSYAYRSSDAWSGVYGMEIDRTTNRLVCCDNGTGKLYLFGIPGAKGASAPALLAEIPGRHVGAPSGDRLYAANGNTIMAYDITRPGAPAALGTYVSPKTGLGYGALKVDAAHQLLYLAWTWNGAVGVDVLGVAAGSFTLRGELTGIEGNFVDMAVSPDGTKLAVGTENGPGGIFIYDVTATASGVTPRRTQVCYASAETRQAVTVEGDSAPYVYSTCRYSYEVHGPDDTLIASGSLGTLIGSRLQPCGTTAGGTDPTLWIAPGAGSSADDYLFRCEHGTITPVAHYGDSTLVNTWWDGKYLSAIPNGYGTFKIVIYSVGGPPSYGLTPVATYTGPFGTQLVSGLFVDGRHGAPGAVLWASDSALGVMAFDVSRFGAITPITAGDLPDRQAKPAPAGGICEIRKASGRIYVSQGDLGILVYNPATMRRSGHVTGTGDPTPFNNPLAAPGIDVYVDGHGVEWIVTPNYRTSGPHGGFVALNTSANPDDPPPTFIPTVAAGFTCRTYRTSVGGRDTGVLFATLCGPVAFRRQ